MIAKHALRYLKGTVSYGLKYEANQKINLEGYVDSYWASSAIDRKSRMESCMALSTTEAKDVATCLAIWEVVSLF